jgi:predicted metallo-beta-lactamase superfamily hydrolase
MKVEPGLSRKKHHLTRDLEYREKIKSIVEKAHSIGKNITTASEYLGMEPDLLETRRKEIYNAEAEQDMTGRLGRKL